MISFSHDPVVTDALRQWQGREHFPTDLSSAQLRHVAREVKERSVFSAYTTNAEYIQEVSAVVDDMLSGKINLATGRWKLMKKLKVLGYDPAVGFPQDMALIPLAEKGSLQDLSSEGRIDLMLETNMRMAASYGQVIAGNRPYALHAYPAWELVRLYIRDVPRGTPESHSVGWERRWTDAGAAVGWEGAKEGGREGGNGRMIALKDSPIWQALGDGAGGYRDTLGNPYPPFAFKSGLAWKAVARTECEALGIIGGGADDNARGARATRPMQAQLSPGQKEVNAAFERLSPDLQDALRKELAA